MSCELVEWSNHERMGLALRLLDKLAAQGERVALGSPSNETKEIMVEFYKELAGGKSNKAEALQNAQLSLIRKDKKYANPFYWAAFEVIGDYR